MELKTKRLKLRTISLADLEEIHKLPYQRQTNSIHCVPDSIETTKQLVLEWMSTQDEVPKKNMGSSEKAGG